ncbi:MAG: OmpH family outer membrane protein [Thermodesulfobacteriota bacterium]
MIQRIILALFLVVALLAGAPRSAAAEEIALAADANLRQGPGPSYPVIAPLRKGTRVTILYRLADWGKITLPGSDRHGWIHLPPAPVRQEQTVQPAAATAAKTIVPATGKQTRNTTEGGQKTSPPGQHIAVIDIQQVINGSRRGREAREKYEEMARTGRENLAQAEEELIGAVIREIHTVVEGFARQRGLTHVINSNAGSLFFHDGSDDITRAIIAEYDRLADQAAGPRP